MSEFDLNQIRRLDGGLLLVFRELLRCGRASETARRLGLTPSAVSHALTRLRDLFDDPLFVRRPHGLEPTRRALELGPRIEALIEMAGQALKPHDGFDPARSGRRFNIAAPEFVTALIGGPMIEALRQEAPGVSFAIGHAAQAAALDGLRRGEADLAIGRFGALPAGVTAEPLFSDRYCVVARRDHPTLRGDIDLAAYNAGRHIFAYAQGEVGVQASETADTGNMVAAVPGWLTALDMVSVTDALATCPERLARRYAERLGLQILKADFELWSFDIQAVRREGADPGVDWFLGLVRATMA
ncbi:LysR family transcriptional regulator [Phenylobacterium sp. LH3H17]|uniref:LysR family transcriptional regulator n=1 Tax=Phenylobacterium sp. LH3H17 TaxID=2903901 RepID=UPI0020CA0846|nr:LysR family transcriptional regulator [Phenylobacterium sp. LH3H17]UTP40212.1 LysR family transcriptional regulator [Phenylobacterium sp. LH3H17]